MPRIVGVRQRRHQPFFDTIIRTTGVPATPVQAQGQLFGNANVGNPALTNLQTPGQLASDQTYVILAFRTYLYFQGTNAEALITQTSSQLLLNFSAGDKPQFFGPAWYFPAGGGVYGNSATAVLNNGYPSQEAILKLARPIIIPVRQSFRMDFSFAPVGVTNALTLLNGGAADDEKIIQSFIDGLQTRDVE